MYHRSQPEVARIAIGCSGPGAGELRGGPAGARRSKDGATLRFVVADIEAVCESAWRYDEPPDAPDVGDLPRVQRLIQATIGDVLGAVHLASEYVYRSLNTKFWSGGGITILFSGHGVESGALLLKDGEITGSQLYGEIVRRARSTNEDRLGVELILDSCYSGGFLADFLACASEANSPIVARDMWAATLPNEQAWELDNLGHGALIFTNLYSGNNYADRVKLARAVREGDDAYIRFATQGAVPNPVTYLTEGDQHSIELLNGHAMSVHGAGDFEIDWQPFTADELRDALDRAAGVDLDVELAFRR